MAQALAAAGIAAEYSYAGRTGAPVGQPIPVRVGGFGGVAGLVAYLQAGGFSHVIDATHPFAAGMSRNAVAACGVAGVGLMAFERAAWAAGPGDDWLHVADIGAAVEALDGPARRVFLAIGRQNLAAFAAAPQHRYLLRLVDELQGAGPLAGAKVVIARGPFDVAGDMELMRAHGTQVVVAKNAGGAGAAAKLAAARALGLRVIMIARPAVPVRAVAHDVAGVMGWLHAAPSAL